MNNLLYRDLSKLTIYDDEQIKEMIIKYKDGDESQLNKIIESNLKLIVMYARQFEMNIKNNQVIELDDLIAEGTFAIKQAVLNFNSDLNVKFNYYINFWIKNQIGLFIINNRNGIRIPIDKIKTLYKIEKDVQCLFQENQYEVSQLEIENLGKYTSTEIDCYYQPIQINDIDDHLNVVEDSQVDESKLLIQKLRNALKYLTPKERTVIKMSYGIDQDAITFEEISKHLNVTKTRISQYKESAMKKLRAVIK